MNPKLRFDRVVGLGLCVVGETDRVDEWTLAAPLTRDYERCVAPGGMMSTALAQASHPDCLALLPPVDFPILSEEFAAARGQGECARDPARAA